MPIQELKQTHYQDATDFNINHTTQDHRQDMTHYHVPLMRMHNAALHRWGIAVGLQVAQTGPAELTIAEGLAIDAQGRMLPLAAEGATPGQPGQAFLHNTSAANLVKVPVAVSTQGMANGAYYATLELATTSGPEGPLEGRFLLDERRIVSTLLVKLQPTATFTPDGTAIILATVALVGGAVTSLSGAERQLARLAVGEVVVHHGAQVGAGPQVGDAVSGRIGPLGTGGVQVTVPGASDKIVLQQEGNHNFQELTVRADHLRVINGAGREIMHVDANATTLQIGANGNAGNLLIQDATGREALRLDAAGAVLRVGGDIDVAGTIRGNLANGLVGTDQLANNAVTTLKIAPGVLPPDIGIAVASSLQNGQSIPVPKGFQRSECVFYVALKWFEFSSDPSDAIRSCSVDADGKVTLTPGAAAMGVAMAKKGGW